MLVAGAWAAAPSVGAIIALPLLPADARRAGGRRMNADVGETIGWPELPADGRATSTARAPGAVILTSNYGEAGAIDRYGPALGLPRAYSGHNAFGDWGPPPNGSAPVVAVGLDRSDIATTFRGLPPRARASTTASASTTTSRARRSTCVGDRSGRGRPSGQRSSTWAERRRGDAVEALLASAVALALHPPGQRVQALLVFGA